MRSNIILAMLIGSIPAVAVAQTAITPLPPVPQMQPLYPSSDATAFQPAPVRQDYAPPPVAITTPRRTPVQVANLSPSAPVPFVAAPSAPPVVQPAFVQTTLPQNTDILLRLNEEVSSKGRKVGDSFRLSVIQDVVMNGVVIIPRGTPAFGSVTWRTGKGMFGKSAKMEISIDRIELAGRSLPLSGRFREEGDGNTGATIGAAVAAGLIAAAFVTGRSAVFPAGREFRVATREVFALRPAPAGQVAAASTAAPND